MKNLLAHPEVSRVTADQCQLGLEVTFGTKRGHPVKKPTGFMSNSSEITKALSKRCGGVHGSCSRARKGFHVACSGRVARDAAIYPKKLCMTIIRGMTNQMRKDGVLKPGCIGLMAMDEDKKDEEMLHSPAHGYSGRFRESPT